MSELQLKAKALISQCRMAAKAEVKILLTKVDAVNNQIAELQRRHDEAHDRIAALEVSHQAHRARLGSMVPVESLDSHKEELSRKGDLIDDLHERLRASQEEIDGLKQCVQARRPPPRLGPAPRSAASALMPAAG